MEPTSSPVWVASVSQLVNAPAGTWVALGGRLARQAEDTVTVADATGEVDVAVEMAASTPAPGTWLRVTGRWTGRHLAEARAETSTEPTIEFPPPDGEWAWFHADQRHRAREVMRRSQLLRGLRNFFEERHYVEVQTPLFVRSPGTEVHLDAFEVEKPHGYLITSPELQMKRLLAAGFPRIYQLGPCFRRDEAGTHHEPEFTMLEWYRAFATADELMDETETLVATVASALGETGPGNVRFDPPWERMTVAEAFDRYANENAFDLVRHPDRFFLTLAETVQPALGTTRPTFLVDWPAELASLAQLKPGGRVADRFEAYVQGIELCNGFGELVDAEEQRRRCELDLKTRADLGKPNYPLDERFLAALREGLPECSGNALGVDRLLFLLGRADRLQDVVAFGHSRR